MRQHDDDLIDPEIAEMLDAIDATLAGEAVDCEHAEVAELALLLAAGAPRPSPGYASELDDRVRGRFARQPEPTAPGVGWRRWRFLPPASGITAAGALVTVVAVVVLSSGGGSSPDTQKRPAASVAARSGPVTGVAAATKSGLVTVPSAASSAPLTAAAKDAAAGAGVVLQPPANGRKITQSAQLALGAAPDRIDAVAQEVFNVVGSFNGIVDHSSVTATGGADGNAQLQLRVPSSSLPQAMSALSRLKFAHVISRTDSSQDVTGQFGDANQQLATATALRTALLKQLANATTQLQIDSLRAQIGDAQATITRAQRRLATLNHEVDLSPISLSIQAVAGPGAISGGSGGFTLDRAAHDAIRVLEVAAGIALIVLAALVPLALLGALGWWLRGIALRRRRDQALDLA